jgi:hypothetical protein
MKHLHVKLDRIYYTWNVRKNFENKSYDIIQPQDNNNWKIVVINLQKAFQSEFKASNKSYNQTKICGQSHSAVLAILSNQTFNFLISNIARLVRRSRGTKSQNSPAHG